MIRSTLCYIQVLADGAGVATLGAAQLAIQTSLVLTNGTILTLGDIEDKVRLRSWNICTIRNTSLTSVRAVVALCLQIYSKSDKINYLLELELKLESDE